MPISWVDTQWPESSFLNSDKRLGVSIHSHINKELLENEQFHKCFPGSNATDALPLKSKRDIIYSDKVPSDRTLESFGYNLVLHSSLLIRRVCHYGLPVPPESIPGPSLSPNTEKMLFDNIISCRKFVKGDSEAPKRTSIGVKLVYDAEQANPKFFKPWNPEDNSGWRPASKLTYNTYQLGIDGGLHRKGGGRKFPGSSLSLIAASRKNITDLEYESDYQKYSLCQFGNDQYLNNIITGNVAPPLREAAGTNISLMGDWVYLGAGPFGDLGHKINPLFTNAFGSLDIMNDTSGNAHKTYGPTKIFFYMSPVKWKTELSRLAIIFNIKFTYAVKDCSNNIIGKLVIDTGEYYADLYNLKLDYFYDPVPQGASYSFNDTRPVDVTNPKLGDRWTYKADGEDNVQTLMNEYRAGNNIEDNYVIHYSTQADNFDSMIKNMDDNFPETWEAATTLRVLGHPRRGQSGLTIRLASKLNELNGLIKKLIKIKSNVDQTVIDLEQSDDRFVLLSNPIIINENIRDKDSNDYTIGLYDISVQMRYLQIMNCADGAATLTNDDFDIMSSEDFLKIDKFYILN